MTRRDQSVGYQSIGYGKPEHVNPNHELYFAPWFLSQCYFEAPGGTWQRDGRKVTWTPNDGKPQRIWVLTDTYDRQGYRMGHWPD